MRRIVIVAVALAISSGSTFLNARSMCRSNRYAPTLIARWHNGPGKEYSLRNEGLELHQIFHTFDRTHFFNHQLPKKQIVHRNNTQSSSTGIVLSNLIEKLIEEIAQKKKKFTHFDVIQNKNFNKRKGYGLLILKFKNHPFVLKLFMETPQSFVKPNTKGFEPRFIFMLGGGINRHLAGLTRVKNLETINNRLKESPVWSSLIDTPRKWFWLPAKPSYLELEGVNISGPNQRQQTKIPAVYGIIADEIVPERKLSMLKPEDTKTAMDLCNFLDQFIDAHIDNFLIEQHTHKIVIVDTEHFPTLVGMKEKLQINNYLDYYGSLSWKCLHESYFLTKRERRERRLQKSITC